MMGNSPPEDQLQIRNREVQFVRNGEVVWHFAIENLILVAEYTTNEGPLLEDYYFVFGAGRPVVYYEVGLRSALNGVNELATELGVKLEPRLANSTDWQSRVLWPLSLVGQTFFDRRIHSRPPGAWNRLKDRVVPRHEAVFDQTVAEYLGRHGE